MVIDVDKTTGDSAAPGTARAVAPLPLADWEHAMRRAVNSSRYRTPSHALASATQAARMAAALVNLPPRGHEDSCVAALVVSLHHLADLHLRAGDIDGAAERLAGAHQQLLGMLACAQRGAALQQAAWRHTRETHSALLRHVADHGQHPAIASTLQAGMLVGTPAGGVMH